MGKSFAILDFFKRKKYKSTHEIKKKKKKFVNLAHRLIASQRKNSKKSFYT